MNTRDKIIKIVTTMALTAAFSASAPLFGAPVSTNATPAKLEMPQSIFIYPSKPQEGRDPFFPKSVRPYIENPEKLIVAPSLTDLVFEGIVPGVNGPLAIINNNTFAPGDEGEVVTKSNQRLTIHCLSINTKANTVTVENNGASIVLSLPNK